LPDALGKLRFRRLAQLRFEPENLVVHALASLIVG